MGNRGRAIVLLLCALLFLGFFHARWAFFDVNQFFWSLDDGCYLRRLGSLFALGDVFPPYACQATGNYFAWGAPLAWAPAVPLARLGNLIPGGGFSEWLIAWISLGSFLAWALAAVLTERFLAVRRPETSPLRRALAAVAVGTASSAFYYATHRQVNAHPVEWLAGAALLVSLAERRTGAALASVGALVAIRYNDAPVFLMVLGAVFDRTGLPRLDGRRRAALAVLGAATLGYAAWLAFFRGYGDVFLWPLVRETSAGDVADFFWGANWGILWTAPWYLAILVAGAIAFPRLTWTARGAWIWMALEAFLCILWRGNGSIFAYRYLTGSYAAALWIAVELVALRPRLRRPLGATLGVSALGSLVLAHFYKGMILMDIGTVLLRGADGVERRFISAPFVKTALAQVGNGELHRLIFMQQSPVVVWLATLNEDWGWPPIFIVEGPTLYLLTLAIAAALLVAGLVAVRLRKTAGRKATY